MNTKLTGKVSGVYSIKITRNSGLSNEFIDDLGEHKNMILNGFFDRFASGGLKPNDWALFVGTGSTAVEENQTMLANKLGSAKYMNSGDLVDNDNVKVGGDYIASTTGTARWGVGEIVGNLAELGVRFGSLLGDTVDTRALIVDSLGVPTTISVTSTDKLEISYTLKYIIPIQQKVTQVDFLGVSTTCTLERVGVLDSGRNNMSSAFAYGLSPSVYWSENRGLYNNPEANISGLNTLTITRSVSNPAPGVRRYSIFFDTSKANQGGGIEYVTVSSSENYRSFIGLHFSPKIIKDDTRTLTLHFDFTLSRA